MKLSRSFLPGFNRRVTLFMIYSAVFHIGMFGITDVILNFYFVSLGYDTQTVAFFQSIPRIGGLLSGLPIGLAANRIGARRLMIYSSMGLAATFVMLVFYPSLPMLIVNRFLLGVFYNAQQIANSPLMVTLTEREYQTHLFSYHNIISMIATSIGSLIGGFLPGIMVNLFPGAVSVEGLARAQTPFAYGASLLVSGLIVLISVSPLFWLKDTAASHNQSSPKYPQKFPWKQLLLLSLPLLLFGFSGGLTFPFYNLFFRTTFHISDETVGSILGVGWLGMGFATVANPWWDRRFGRAWALGITLSLASVAFLGLSIAPTLGLSIITFVFAISLRNTMQPLFQPLLMDTLPPNLHNMASSINMVLWNIGWFVATSVSGFWQTAYGFGFIMRVVAVGVFITGMSVVLIFRQRPAYREAITLAD